MEIFQRTKNIKAMTLVEVLIALIILSLVFVYVINVTFASLKTVKRLEMQDRMLAAANEGVEIIRKEKLASWTAFTFKLPNVGSQAYIEYQNVSGTKKASLKELTRNCTLNADGQIPTGCETTIICNDPAHLDTCGEDALFGRIIQVASVNNSLNSYMQLTITVACLQGQCSGNELKPVVLTTYVYKSN